MCQSWFSISIIYLQNIIIINVYFQHIIFIVFLLEHELLSNDEFTFFPDHQQ